MSIYSYILLMALVTWLIRLIPLTIFRKPINNRFIRSFLYYVPYITLAAMVFPAIIETASNPLFGVLAFISGLILAWFNGNIFVVELGVVAVMLLCHIF